MAVVRFADFRFDTVTGRLARGGERIALQGAPAQVLRALIAADGGMVSHATLYQAAWPDRTVAFDQSLHTAVKQLRHALGDDARNPRFIATVSRRGYRFVGDAKKAAPVVITIAPAQLRQCAVLLFVGVLLAWPRGSAKDVGLADGARQGVDAADVSIALVGQEDWRRQRRVWGEERDAWRAERARWAAERPADRGG